MATAFLGRVSAQDTCLIQVKPSYGGPLTSGDQFSDFAMLFKQEGVNYVGALSALQVCTNSAGDLIGMTGEVTFVDKTTRVTRNRQPLNKIGNVPADLSGCSIITWNVTAGEYPNRIAAVTTAEQVTMVVVQTPGKSTTVKGTQPSGSAIESFSFNDTSNPILGFYGSYTSNSIINLGAITQNLTCSLNRAPPADTAGTVTTVAIIVVFGLLLLVVACSGVVFMRKKAQKKLVANEGTMLTDQKPGTANVTDSAVGFCATDNEATVNVTDIDDKS